MRAAPVLAAVIAMGPATPAFALVSAHAATSAAHVARNDALARRVTTFGLTYKPLYNVAFKGDYQLRRNRAGVGEDEQLSLGVGYQF